MFVFFSCRKICYVKLGNQIAVLVISLWHCNLVYLLKCTSDVFLKNPLFDKKSPGDDGW